MALVAVGIATVAQSIYFYRGIVDYRPPFPQMADESAPRRNGPSLAGRVIVVVIDGLRVDVSREMDALNLLRAQGVDAISITGLPSLSSPGDAAIFTGAWQEFSGVTTNLYTGPRPDSVFDEAKRSDLTTATAGYGSVNGMFGQSIDNQSESWENRDILSHCLDLIDDGRFNLLAVHFSQPDLAGHHHGGISAQYREAALEIDGHIYEIIKHLDLSECVIIVTSDHGHSDEGGHGGGDGDVVETPLIMAGRHVRETWLGTVNQTDIAPTISVILGMPIPLICQGRPLIQALDIDDAARDRILELNAYQKSNLYRDYRIFLGLDQRALPTANAGNLSALEGEVKESREERIALERERRLPWAVMVCILPMAYLRHRLRRLAIPSLGTSLYIAFEAIIYRADEKALTINAIRSEGSIGAISFLLASGVMGALLVVCAIEALLARHIRSADGSHIVERLFDTFILIFEFLLIQIAYFVYANPIGISWALPDITGSFDFLVKCLEASVITLTSPIYIWVTRLLYVTIDSRSRIRLP